MNDSELWSPNQIWSRSEPFALRVKNTSVNTRWGRVRLALLEISVCMVIPLIGLVTWMHQDKELRTALLAGFRGNDIPTMVNPVYDMLTMADGTVVTLQSQGQIQFWDISSSRRLGEMQSHLAETRCFAYSPRHNLLAVGSGIGQLEMWDLNQPDQPIATIKSDATSLDACEFTPDGQLLCSAGEFGDAVFWDPWTLVRRFEFPDDGHRTPIRSLSFTHDGKFLLTGNKRGTVTIWNMTTRSLVRTLPVTGQKSPSEIDIPNSIIEAILIQPDDSQFSVVTRSRGISVWDLSTGACVRRWGDGLPANHSAALSHDGSRIVTGDVDGKITTWKFATGKQIECRAAHSCYVRSLACSADGATVISGDNLGRIHCRAY